ncbi:MAG TPA: radical SAM family heme chaperone HemW, partial [Tepidisphaeraceae bacterium]|nr:radical SAM family heme chaperone HemW [Tepidisphaeraceae bacterium]
MPLPVLSDHPGPLLPDLPPADVEALYLHVPFCFHKCHYCDFYSITRQTPQRMNQFVNLILREADLWLETAPVRPVLRTLFIGGGTPSLLPADTMRHLLEGIARRFDLDQLTEWTVEVNPATADLDYCHTLRSGGVTRLSFGAQSFEPEELRVLERHHQPHEVARSVDLARRTGFERINLDLIFAIPGQSLESWDRSLSAAIALGTEHLSCYGLTYEPNTPLAVRKRLGQVVAAEESIEVEMLMHTRRRLRGAGFDAYEISNYARPGEACRHNLMYWTGANYIGLGPSAASHVAGHRFRNKPHLGEWESSLSDDRLPLADVEQLDPERRRDERLLLMLRLSSGV